MEEPRFDPLDYVSVFNRRKWWFIVPAGLAFVIGCCWSGCCRAATRRRRRSRSAPRARANVVGAVADAIAASACARWRSSCSAGTVLERTARLEHLDQKDRSTRRSTSEPRQLACRCPTRSRRLVRRPTTALARAEGSSSTATRWSTSTALAERRAADRQPPRAGLRRGEQPLAGSARAGHVAVHRHAAASPARTRLNALEGRLRTMKESFMGRLPEQTSANLAMVDRLQRQLESNATRCAASRTGCR